MALKVVVAYTGGVGSALIRLLHGNPRFELVGVLVHSEDKDGRDAGEIVGLGPIGVRATRDVEALVALKADALSFHGLAWQPELIASFLRAGTSVYTSMGGWFLPGQPDFDLIQQAGEDGGAALVGGGNIPGLISDVLPLFASGYSADVTRVVARQADHVPHYPSAFQLQNFLGFGQPAPEGPFDPEAPLTEVDQAWMWGIAQSAQIVARGLGIPFETVRLTNKEIGLATTDLTLQPSGLEVPRGTVAGSRWTFVAYSNGTPFYELVNEQTCQLDLGPGWRHSVDEPNWQVRIEGTPTVEVTFGLAGAHDDPDHVSALNAARALNFLPRIAAAGPGWRTVLDVPAPVGVPAAALQ